MDRRTFIRGATAGTAGSIVGISGCLGNGGDGGDGGDGGGADSVDIGLLGPLSGPFQSLGNQLLQGAELAATNLNEEGDRTYTIHEADTELSSETAVRRARSLIQNQDVDVIAGIATSDIASAVSEFASTQDTPVIVCSGSTPTITAEDCRKSTFRIHASTQQHQYATAEGALELTDISGDDRIAAVLPDYTLGTESWEFFRERLSDNLGGLNIVNESYPQVGQGNYQNEIQETLNAEPDVIYTSLYVGDLIPFIRQGKDLDLFQQDIPVIFGGGSLLSVTQALGDDMIEGPVGYDHYYFEVPDTEMNNQFVEQYQNEYGHPPFSVDAESHAAVLAVDRAVDETGGTSFDDVVGGLEGLEFDEPGGSKHIRAADHATVEEFIPVGRIGPTESDRIDYYGFSEVTQVPGEDVTPEPNCTF